MKRKNLCRKAWLLLLCMCGAYSINAQKVDFTVDKPLVCQSSVITFTNKSDLTFPPSTMFIWMVGNQTSRLKQSDKYDFVCNQPGKMSVSLQAVDTLQENKVLAELTKADIVTVINPPLVTITASTNNTCVKQPIEFTATQVGGDDTVRSWEWVFGDKAESTENTVINKITHKYTVPSTIPFQAYVRGKLSDKYGACKTLKENIVYAGITITDPKIEVSFDPSVQAICGDEKDKEISFKNTTTGEAVRWEWLKDNQRFSTDSSTSTRFSQPSWVTLNAYSDNGCKYSDSTRIRVYTFDAKIIATDTIPVDTVAQKWPNKKLLCPGTTITLKADGYLSSFTRVIWSVKKVNGTDSVFGNSSKLVIKNIQTGDYNVKLTVSSPGSCAGSKSYDTIISVEGPNKTIPQSTHVCAKKTVTEIKATATLSGSTFQYRYPVTNDTLRGGATIRKVFPMGKAQVLFIPISTNGCVGTPDTMTVITEIPQAQFSTSNYEGCAPVSTTFKDASIYEAIYSKDTIVSYTWILGRADAKNPLLKERNDSLTTSKEISCTYHKEGIYRQGLIVTTRDGCTDTVYQPLCDNYIHVGHKPTFTGFIEKPIICASGKAILNFKGSLPLDSLTSVNALFISTKNSEKTIGGGDENCFRLGKESIMIPFAKADSMGYYDLHVQLKHNGCPMDQPAAIPNAVFVNGPRIEVGIKDTALCSDPYKYSLNITKKIWANDWTWRVEKQFLNEQNEPYLVLIDSSKTRVNDTVHKIDFENTVFNIDNSDIMKRSGDYVITLRTVCDTAIVDGKACSYQTSIPVRARNIKAKVAVYDKNGVARGIVNGKTAVCWTDSLKFDTRGSVDVKSFDDWFAWRDNTVDSISKKQFWMDGSSTPHTNWKETTTKWYKSGKIFDSLKYYIVVNERGGDTLELASKSNKDSARYGVFVHAYTDNERSCQDSVFLDIQAYRPQPKFKIDILNYCVTPTTPFKVKFIDISSKKKTDSSLIARWWKTEGDLIKEINDLTSFTEIFKGKRNYNPRLILRDDVGCLDTFFLPTKLKPTVPDIRFTGPHRVCLSSESPEAIAKFSMPLTADTLYTTTLEKAKWSIGDTTTNLKVEGKIDTVWTRELWTNPAIKDTIYHAFKYTNERIPIILETWALAPNNQLCKNEITDTAFKVRSIHSKIQKALTRDIIACAPDAVQIYTPDQLDVTKILWQKYANNRWLNISQDDITANAVAFYRDEVGNDSIKLTLITEYIGCDTLTQTYPVKVLSYKLQNIVADKDSICIGETVNFKLADTSIVDGYKFKWVFGDGSSDSLKAYSTSHTFDHLVKGSNGTVSTINRVYFVLTLEDKNCEQEYRTQDISIHNLAAEFDRGKDDLHVKGCIPFTVPFVNNSIGKRGSYTTTWSFDDGTTSNQTDPEHVFKEHNKTYSVTLLLEDSQCKNVHKTKTITTLKHPQVSLSQIGVVCFGDEKTLTADTAFVENFWWKSNKYMSDTLQTRQIIHLDTATAFYSNAISSDKCSRSDTVFAKVQKRPHYLGSPYRPLVYIHEPNDTLTEYARKPYELMPYVEYSLHNDSLAGVSYQWQPSTGLSCDRCANPRIMLTDDVTFVVTMVDSNRCFTAKDTVKLITVKETRLSLPTAFTPNGDGDNDRAWVRGWGIREFLDVRIYNRWGQLVYESSDIKDGWDGTYNGVAQNTETFAFVVRAKDYTDKLITQKGYITLIR